VPNGPAQAGVGSVGWPKCDSCWSPEYSDQARAAKLEGTITLSATIQQDGHATDVAVVKGLGMGLDENAVKAVQKWTFDPARGPDGTPVPVITDIEITFSLNLPNVAASAPGGNNSPVLAGTEGVGFPKCLDCPRPDYSMEARAAKLQGTVLLSATFQADGHVTDIMVVNSLGLGLDEKAIQATQGWRVQPALDSHGTPVSVTTQITVTFHML
ncbi:MAG: energy transducer TonB, partial [Candidatus Acidiferrales bacterium]